MQTANRLFYSKTPVADDNEPVYLRRTKPHLIVRLTVFVCACLAGWALAWCVHMLVLWVRHPEVAPAGVNALGEGIYHVFANIRHTLNH